MAYKLANSPYERVSERGEDRTIQRWESGGKHTYRRRQIGSLKRDIRRRERRADYGWVLATLCSTEILRPLASPLWCDTQKNKHYIHTRQHSNESHWHGRYRGCVQQSAHTIPTGAHKEESQENWAEV